MKILKHILMFIGAGVLFVSCEDQMIRESQMPYPNDVTFNKEENSIDIEVPALQFVQFDPLSQQGLSMREQLHSMQRKRQTEPI